MDEEYVKPYRDPLPTDLSESSVLKLPPSHVRLFVLEARGLKNADAQEGGLSDPFVMIMFTDMRGNPYDSLMFKTQVIQESLNPTWNEEFLLELKPGDPACACRCEVWDADRDTGRDFLGTARLQFDTASGTSWLDLGPRLQAPDRLRKPVKSMFEQDDDMGQIKVKWQYERISTPKKDAEWFVKRGEAAISNRKYDLATQLFLNAQSCCPDDPTIEAHVRNASKFQTTEKSGIKEDVTGSFVSDNELTDLFNYLDVNNNGWLSKKEFAQIYKEYDLFGGMKEGEDVIQDTLRQYNMMGDDKISFPEFALIMLKLAQK